MEYLITGYCSIRNSGVIADDRLEHFEEKFVTFADFIKSLYKKEGVNYPKFFKMDGLSKLGFLTAELLLKRREMDRYRKERVGLVLSNSSSSLDTDLAYCETIRDRTNYFPSPSVFVYTLPNIMNGEICIRHKFRGENTFLIAEQFDSALLYTVIGEAMDMNRVDVCIGGWIELLRDRYESLLFLVESKENIAEAAIETSREFSKREIDKLYLKI
jgi:hypothetical protein